MQIAIRRGVLVGVVLAALVLTFAAVNRVPLAVSPASSAQQGLGSTPLRVIGAGSLPAPAPLERAEDPQGAAEPDCQQSRDLLRAGADSQG